MKRVIALLLVYILPALCLAQTSANHQLPDDIKVLEATWYYGVDWRNPTAGDPTRQLEQRRANNQLGPLDTEQTLFLRTRRDAAVVTIHNEGSKTIKAISYDFVFVNTQNGEEWFRYQFRNRATIGAGETKTLTNHIVGRRIETFGPSRVEPATGVNSEIRVVMNRIEYADGSIWRRR
jgi:hypothetical protein